MNKIRFGEALQVLPVLVPAAGNDAVRVSSFVDLSLAHWCTFAVQFGAISVTDTGLITISVEGSTAGADSDTETAVDFSYRYSHAPGSAPSMSTITACESTATNTVSATDVASTVLLVDVDPSVVADAGFRYVRMSIDPAADTTSSICGVVAYLEPRYPGNAMPSNFTST